MPKLIFTSHYLRDAPSAQLENYVRYIGTRENYVDYIANRPRVERIGEHGLFTDAGKAVVLSQVQEEVASHKGAVWTRSKSADSLKKSTGKYLQNTMESTGNAEENCRRRNRPKDINGMIGNRTTHMDIRRWKDELCVFFRRTETACQ